jgi:hypothetical protein
VLLATLLTRKAWRISTLFPVYIAAVLLPDAAFSIEPRLFTWNAWLAKETIQAGLKLGLALELTTKVFAGLPRARRIADGALVLLVVGAQALVAVSWAGADPELIAKRSLPLVNDATSLAFCTILALATWYAIPVHVLHRAILQGLAPFLLVFSLALHALEAWGWSARLGSLAGLAYDLLVTYWIVAALAPPQAIPAAVPTIRRLRPWA